MTAQPSATRSGPLLEALGATLAARWWIVALRGAIAVIFGLIAFFAPAATMLSLVVVFAVYALADGVIALAAVVTAGRTGTSRGLLILEGVVSLLAGIAALAWPGLTVLVFVTLIGGWAMLTGALMLGAAFRLRADHGRWWLILCGIASIIYGAMLFIAPMVGAVVLAWWIGAYALVFGAALLMMAFRLRKIGGRALQHGDSE